MTKVSYKCKDVNGKEFMVATWPEAKKIEEDGGSYEIAYDYTPSREDSAGREAARGLHPSRR